MTRNEMVKKVAQVLEVANRDNLLETADMIVFALEREGMQPPKKYDDVLMTFRNEWSTEE